MTTEPQHSPNTIIRCSVCNKVVVGVPGDDIATELGVAKMACRYVNKRVVWRCWQCHVDILWKASKKRLVEARKSYTTDNPKTYSTPLW